MDPVVEKRQWRKHALAARGTVPDRERREAAINAGIADLVARGFPGAAVATYFPMRDEIDTRPGLALHAGPLCLPVVVGARQPLVFRRWSIGEELDAGHFGTSHPAANAPEVIPQLVLTPLAGFDRHGHRLGYGGGFYDRTLAGLRARGAVTAVGIAFRAQEVPPIPVHAGDQVLDAILTEDGLHSFAPA